MKKGFTLIEMIAVIGIIAIMSIMVMPLIMNQIAEKKEKISDTTNDLIFTAVDLYLNDNISNFPKQVGSKYCVKLETLVSKGYLKSPLKDVKTGKQLDTSRFIKIEVNAYGDYADYVILDKGESCN